MKVLELFAGLGACSKALERLGVEHEIVDAVEIDKYAIASFNAIHGTNFETQDITTWDKDIEVDLIMHGSPCQDFSLAGKQAGGDIGSGTRSSLMYETIRIVGKLRPKYVIWENVKNLLSEKHRHNFDAYLETMKTLGYTNYYQVLNAKDYGIPQNRERVFTISIKNDNRNGFEFPKKQSLELKVKDLLEDEVEEKYYLSEKMIGYISKSGTKNFKNHDSKINLEIARPLTTVHDKRAGTTNYISEQLPANYNLTSRDIDKTIRRLTPKECFRLMGFDDEDFEKSAKINSNTQLYKQAGNSIVVNVLVEIFKQLFNSRRTQFGRLNIAYQDRDYINNRTTNIHRSWTSG
jgi:DNA (cytosine-5)-methyltransferase 1